MTTEKERKAQVIADTLAEKQPSTPQAHAITFAFLTATENVTQREYAEALGISDRTVRKYISQHKQDYEEEIRRAEGELKQILGRSKQQREMMGSELDAFLNILIEKGTDPNGSTQDRKLLIEFTGLSGKDLIARQAQKGSTLHWWILNNLGTIATYLNTRSLGINIFESEYVCREDSETDGQNLQNFLDRSIFEDATFIRESAYWGLLFMSIYNEESHPDLELLGDLVRLDRALKRPEETADEREERAYRGLNGAEKYARGKDYHKPTGTSRSLDDLLKEVFDLPPTATKAELEAKRAEFNEKHPSKPQTERVIPLKRADVVKRVNDNQELLKLHLTVDEWLYPVKIEHQ